MGWGCQHPLINAEAFVAKEFGYLAVEAQALKKLRRGSEICLCPGNLTSLYTHQEKRGYSVYMGISRDKGPQCNDSSL